MQQKNLKTRVIVICLMLFLTVSLIGQAPGSAREEIALSDVDDNGRVDIIDCQIIIQRNADSIHAIPNGDMYQSLLNKARSKWNKLNLDYYEYEYMQYCFCINAGIPFAVQVKYNTIISIINKNDGTEVPEYQYEYFHTIDGLFDIIQEAIDNNYHIMSLAFDPVYFYPAEISIDYIKNAIDDEMTYLASKLRAMRKVKFSSLPPSCLQKDPFRLSSAFITGDILSLTLQYSGGCVEHDYILYIQEGFMESYPVQVNCYLWHDAHNDPCDAIITDTPCFDLTPLSKVYQEMYQRNDPIILNIHDYFTSEPGKIIRVMYIPR
jgi:hypothetical protein